MSTGNDLKIWLQSLNIDPSQKADSENKDNGLQCLDMFGQQLV